MATLSVTAPHPSSWDTFKAQQATNFAALCAARRAMLAAADTYHASRSAADYAAWMDARQQFAAAMSAHTY